jgi:hypothetical protein
MPCSSAYNSEDSTFHSSCYEILKYNMKMAASHQDLHHFVHPVTKILISILELCRAAYLWPVSLKTGWHMELMCLLWISLLNLAMTVHVWDLNGVTDYHNGSTTFPNMCCTCMILDKTSILLLTKCIHTPRALYT